MCRCLSMLTLVLAGLAAAGANAQSPGLSARVNLSASGTMAPIPARAGARNPTAAAPPWCSETDIDPDTGTVYAGTPADRWPVWPITPRTPKYDCNAFPTHVSSKDQTGPGGLPPGLLLLGGTASADALDILDERKINHGEAIQVIAYSRDGKLFATASPTLIRVWDMSGPTPQEKCKVRFKKRLGLGGVRSLAFFPDGKSLAMGGGDNALHVYDLDGPMTERLTLKDQNGAIQSLAFSPDGKTLAAGNDDMTILFYDMTGDQPKERYRFKVEKAGGGVKQLLYAPDGTSLVLGTGNDGILRVLDVSGAKPVAKGKGGKVRGGFTLPAARSPDGKWLVVDERGSKNLKMFAVTADDLAPAPTPKTEMKEVGALAWSPDGAIFAAAEKGGRVLLFDPAGKLLMDRQRSGNFQSAAFAPSAQPGESILAVADWSGPFAYVYRLGKAK